MPRPSSHKLMLTLDEIIWVTRTITRIAAQAAKVDPVPGEDKLGITYKEHKNIQKFADKTAMLPSWLERGETVALNASRVELKILQKIAKNEHAALLTKIIPGYMEKMHEEPTRIKAYLTASEERAALILGILNKISEMVGV